MPQRFIDRVDQLGKSEVQPKLLIFFDRKGCLICENKQADPYYQPTEYDMEVSDLYTVNTNY